jgi:hypothetical protein
VLSYWVTARGQKLFWILGIFSSLNGFAVVGSLAFLLTRPAGVSTWTLAAAYGVSALPFVLAGMVISLAVTECVERVDRVYFFDLVGAAAGCLLLIPLLNSLGGPNTVVAAGVLFVSAGAVWFSVARSARGRIVAVGIALGFVWLVAFNLSANFLDVRTSKGANLANEEFVRWNSFSRIALMPEGEYLKKIVIDGDAATAIAPYDFDALPDDVREALLSQALGFPYVLRPAAKALIIGPGGGFDVARALASGSPDVTGVEINPIIADTIMREDFASLSHGLYLRPEVKMHVEDGRSFIRRSGEKYEVIQATLVDTWASTAAGAFALSENNLYTTGAFEDYLSHLTGSGILAFSRWGFDPPRESLRLVTLAAEALERLGEREPWRNILVGRENAENVNTWGALDTVLISRGPFSDAEIAVARQFFRRHRVEMAYEPGQRGNAFGDFLLAPDRSAFLENYTFDVSPVSDDRPFFFYTVQPRDLWAFVTSANRDAADYKVNRAVPTLFALVGLSLVGTTVILALPPLVMRKRLPLEPGVRGFLLYFLFIGIGYILIQVALIQNFVLFLGHPTYALTVIIFSMLTASGLGSFWSRRLGAFERGRVARVLIAVALGIAILAAIVTPLTGALVWLPLPARALLTVLMIAPVAFLMGMPFPSGLARLEAWHKPALRWAWSLNAAASVLGSALAIFLALNLGLRATLLIGGSMYLLALLASARPKTEAR